MAVIVQPEDTAATLAALTAAAASHHTPHEVERGEFADGVALSAQEVCGLGAAAPGLDAATALARRDGETQAAGGCVVVCSGCGAAASRAAKACKECRAQLRTKQEAATSAQSGTLKFSRDLFGSVEARGADAGVRGCAEPRAHNRAGAAEPQL